MNVELTEEFSELPVEKVGNSNTVHVQPATSGKTSCAAWVIRFLSPDTKQFGSRLGMFQNRLPKLLITNKSL